MAACYLIVNQPRRPQFRAVRRAPLSGVTVLHTAEGYGAEKVARFICDRPDPGSYHDLVDETTAIQLVPYSSEAYQDGTGSNPHALSISWAIQAADWSTIGYDRRQNLLRQGAEAFARQQRWLRKNGYPITPLRRISKEQSNRLLPGFVTHGDRDPGRRSDPGDAFPWGSWFDACKAALTPSPPKPSTEDEDMRIIYAPERASCLLRGDGRLEVLHNNDEVRAYEAAGVDVYSLTSDQWDRIDTVSKRIGRITP